jgi:3-oxoacyl-[acyl-carrier-protein] synthase II
MARAVITGAGCITPIGHGVEEFWRNLTAGVSGVGPITLFDPAGMECRIAAEVKRWDAQRYMEGKAARRASRFSQFAIAAAGQALEDAGLPITEANRDEVGIVMNTGGGGIGDVAEAEGVRLTKGPARVTPMLIPLLAPNMASCRVAMQHGIRGPVVTSVAACAAGIYAFVEAKRLIDGGEAEVVIAGGSEAGIIPVAIASLCNAKALSTRNDEPEKASRPFDLHRDGFVFGEGAAALVVERKEHALAREARILAELAGGALTCDAYHVTAPEPSGEAAALAMRRALRVAGLQPEAVDYIAAHGTGTPLNDVTETLAIKKALGEHAYQVAISSLKSMVGHLLGAAGAVSALAAVLSIRDGVVPPTINLETPDPACDLDYIPQAARRQPVRVAMVNGFGFGGQNAVAIFREFQADAGKCL